MMRHGYLACLFRDDDGQGIRILGDADSRAVPSAKIGHCRDIVGEGKHDTAGHDAITPDDHRRIVER